MKNKRTPAVSILLWTLTLGGAGLLFFFSGQNGDQSGRLSMMVTRLILRILPGIPLDVDLLHTIVRKLAHFGIFALEGALLCAALISTLRRLRLSALLSAAVCIPMAVLNECHQYFMDGRSCEVRDMIIDSAGALAGILFAAAAAWLICRKRNVII